MGGRLRVLGSLMLQSDLSSTTPRKVTFLSSLAKARAHEHPSTVQSLGFGG